MSAFVRHLIQLSSEILDGVSSDARHRKKSSKGYSDELKSCQLQNSAEGQRRSLNNIMTAPQQFRNHKCLSSNFAASSSVLAPYRP